MKLVRCKCGVTHECAARMSNRERAVKAAGARSRFGVGLIETEIAPKQAIVDKANNEKVETLVAATKAVQQVPAKIAKILEAGKMPGDACEKHGTRFCRACG